MAEKEKQTRTPRNLESIKTGALALSLEDRGELCKALKHSIDVEVEELQKKAAHGANIASQLAGPLAR